ncbi:MAG: DEAD/DEAH box helicase family protein [Kiritimatiellae bacterium]|jgi:type III restriction enzyme|nr:DEAD/DEAH box helicase family protein [Kiritimatiellia bacterium]
MSESKKIGFKYEPDLEFQREAIDAVLNLFEGIPPNQGDFEVSLGTGDFMGTRQMELGVANAPLISGETPLLGRIQLMDNLHAVQNEHMIPRSKALTDYPAQKDEKKRDRYEFPNFSIEMETGTGKTYVYLRTIFELNEKYGLKKFIIVVPSVAVREGVLSSIKQMRDHFKSLYNNVPFESFVYNSKDVHALKDFARNSHIQIMIINIQAFQKDAGDVEDYASLSEAQIKKLNVIHRDDDQSNGYRWIQYVQKTNPILIIDEPQSVDNTPKAKRAITTLHPQLCLRYSATHINPYNLIYKLDPIRAYEMNLVKQIEVASIKAGDNFNDVYIRLDSVGYAGKAKSPQAKATIHETKNGVPKTKKVTLKQDTDIAKLTNREGYEGYVVSGISAESGLEHVEFANGKLLMTGEEQGGMGDEILKAQVRATVEEHLKKERKFKDKGIKILSLFFIDKVSNYRMYDDEGVRSNGKIAQWFEEAYRELTRKPLYKDLIPYAAEKVHDGYFSEDRKKGKVVALKDSSGSTKADEETYEKIMRDKERLLSLDEPLRFIFSHSALKEGWDNPNVFQICTLREMGTDRERRQTLGRGLRLPVNKDLVRIYDSNINRLTVIASESFEEYAKGLQSDIERDLGGDFRFGRVPSIAFAKVVDPKTEQPIGQTESESIWKTLVKSGYLDYEGDITSAFRPEDKSFKLKVPGELEPIRAELTDVMKRYIFKNRMVKNASEKPTLQLNRKCIELNDDFKALWERISKKTRYCVEFKTEDLIDKAVAKLEKMEPIRPVQILSTKTEVALNEAGVEGVKEVDSRIETVRTHTVLPDMLAFIQRETELTRGTLVEILTRTQRLKEFADNPQAFMTEVSRLINRSLHEMVVDGIKYEQIDDCYQMRLFEEDEVQEYLTRLYEVQSTDDRTLYDFVPFDSEVEREVAERLDTNENVKFYCKLPRWFTIPTPVGTYNPDWAVVTEQGEMLYLVRETKSTHDRDQRRDNENRKVDCGRAHFQALDVNFKVATSIAEVLAE